MTSWEGYYIKRAAAPERPLLKEALNYVQDRRSALDLGAGSMNDSKFLVSENFELVTAVDADPDAMNYAKEIHSKNFTFVNKRFDEFVYQDNSYDLISAQFALPFIEPTQFTELFKKMIAALKVQGVICGQFFGKRDSWNIEGSGMSFHSHEEIVGLCKKLQIITLTEEENDGETALGSMKHWHIFNLIAIKE